MTLVEEPTKARCKSNLYRNRPPRSVDQHLQLFHRKRPDGLRCWLCLEDTRFFGEWIHPLASRSRRPHFQLQIKHTGELERSTLLYLPRCDRQYAFNGTFDFLRLQTCGLSDSTVCSGSSHGRPSFHRGFHSLHGFLSTSYLAHLFGLYAASWTNKGLKP